MTVAASPTREALARAVSPLSSYQRRVWRLMGTHAERALFERIGVRISGPLSWRAARRAARGVVRCHEILRATFPSIEGRPVQYVRPDGGAAFLLADLRALAAPVRERAAQRLTRRSTQPRFDCARGPLTRFVLLRLASDEHIWLTTIHHLIFDGSSRPILMRDLQALLLADGNADAAPAADAVPQYAGFARREQHPSLVSLRAARLAAALDGLRPRTPPATLVSDRPRWAYRTRRGAFRMFEVPRETLSALRRRCRTDGLSLFMLLLAALAVAIRDDSGREEIVCGVPVVNRTSTDAEAAIGPFINILLVRLRAAADMTASEVIAATRSAVLDAFALRDLPFDDVLRALHPDVPLESYGPSGGTPLFRVCASFEEDVRPPAVPGALASSASPLRVTPFEAGDAIAGCDVTISFTATASTLTANVLYSAELFDAATIERFTASYLRVLETTAS